MKVYVVIASEYEAGYEDSEEIVRVDSVYSDSKKAKERAKQIIENSYDNRVIMYPSDNRAIWIECLSPNGLPYDGLSSTSKYEAWVGNVSFGAWVEEHIIKED